MGRSRKDKTKLLATLCSEAALTAWRKPKTIGEKVFGRNDSPNVEETNDEETKRSPLIPAIIAGALTLVGVLLLVGVFKGNAAKKEEVADIPVLMVATQIDAGTPLSKITANPDAYLTINSVPEQYVPEGAISDFAALEELGDVMLSSRAAVGEYVLASRFVNRDDFDRASFIDRAAPVQVPDGHQKVVVKLPAERALGGNVRPGDTVSIVSSFKILIKDEEPFEISMLVLPAVEVINVQTDLTLAGDLSGDVESVGLASSGDYTITLAVTPPELTDLAYSLEYGSLILAGALADATPDDTKNFTMISTLIRDQQLDLKELNNILEVAYIVDKKADIIKYVQSIEDPDLRETVMKQLVESGDLSLTDVAVAELPQNAEDDADQAPAEDTAGESDS